MLDTVVVIPVSPAIVSVSPVLNVSFDPESAANVNELEAGAEKDRLPEPSVTKT